MSRPQILIYLAFVVAAALYFSQGDRERQRRPDPRGFQTEPGATPRPRSAEGTRPLPAPSVTDPTLDVAEGLACEPACSGTAFAVDRHGNWLTAKHVVENCNTVVLMTGEQSAVRVQKIVTHPVADVGVLRTALDAPPLRLGSAPLELGQSSFHFGYPQGDPGDVHGRLLGRVKVRRHGGRDRAAPGLMWAEVSRHPPNNRPLGGLSGGAALDREGHIVGVLIASSHRRGRVSSAAPVSLRQTLAQAGLDPAALAADGRGPTAIDGSSYGDHGDRLRAQLTVAKVYCLAEDPWK
jgi:S1-C subfamily serine protease